MLTPSLKKFLLLPAAFTCSMAFSSIVNATIVEFQTSHGSFQVNLFDQTTPKTVDNFLTYLDDGHYTNSVIHRVAPDFVVQGGGYEFSGEWPLTALGSSSPIINEPVYSNVQGTIAMAKKGNSIHSATDQWFFNLEDNSNNLDRQNGGFTVFGQVIGDGMSVIQTISQLRLCNAGSLEGIPLVMTQEQSCADFSVPGIQDFVVIESITIIDSSEVTDSTLTPLKSKEPDSDGDGVIDIADAFPADSSKYLPETDVEKSSGGSFTWFSWLVLLLLPARRRLL